MATIRQRLINVNRHYSKLLVLTFWLMIVGIYWWYVDRYGISPLAMLKEMGGWFVNSIYGPPVFILFFALQPLIFFPSALVGITAGFLYGPIYGVIYAFIGAIGAATTSYTVGRFFGHGMLETSESSSLLHHYAERLRNNTFEVMLTMHLIFLPYDLVNYIGGFLRVDWKQFILATTLGSIPGVLTFVLFGASLEGDMLEGTPAINPTTLAISGIMLVVSLMLSRYFRWREKQRK
jgi:uncharacterized membrane protein YdjX (TVP38/TMEM64 family)